ncbi:MAG: hypothetical protein K1X75_05715 [Leptospirales bacterium]|nr:hypothetical protein [Leptospirales bacterium]
MTVAELQGLLGRSEAGSALYRALVQFPDWLVPVISAQGDPPEERFFSLSIDGQSALPLFSETSLAEQWAPDAEGGVARMLRLNGAFLFSRDLSAFEMVILDPDAPSERRLASKCFLELARMAASCGIEGLLQEFGSGDPPDIVQSARHLINYRDYQIMTLDGERSSQLALAPDARGRRLAAVFTSEDRLQPFADWLQNIDGSKKYAREHLSGRDLFGALRNMPLDGVVFNCNSPDPLAFSADFFDLLFDVELPEEPD